MFTKESELERRISKALIIAEPWIDYIFDGSKTWEMRSTATSHRGWFGLIRKGSGAVEGVARLVEAGQPLSPSEMIETVERHRIPKDAIRSGAVAKWNTPWKLADIRRLEVPVPYRHKSGAVTWVSLDQATCDAVDRQNHRVSGTRSGTSTQARQPSAQTDPGNAAHARRAAHQSSQSALDRTPISPGRRLIGEIEINEANLRNNHFYLRPLVHKFPSDAIGGSNKSQTAKREVLLDWGGPTATSTDIDGADKKFFRARAWIGSFFKLNRARPGDLVVIEETAPYRYRVRLRKKT